MWSVIVTVCVCAALLIIGALVQHKERKQTKTGRAAADEGIHKVAEIAQRRHKAKFGREDTGLYQALSGKEKRS